MLWVGLTELFFEAFPPLRRRPQRRVPSLLNPSLDLSASYRFRGLLQSYLKLRIGSPGLLRLGATLLNFGSVRCGVIPSSGAAVSVPNKKERGPSLPLPFRSSSFDLPAVSVGGFPPAYLLAMWPQPGWGLLAPPYPPSGLVRHSGGFFRPSRDVFEGVYSLAPFPLGLSDRFGFSFSKNLFKSFSNFFRFIIYFNFFKVKDFFNFFRNFYAK